MELPPTEQLYYGNDEGHDADNEGDGDGDGAAESMPNVGICRTVYTEQHPDDHRTPPRRRAHNAECQNL